MKTLIKLNRTDIPIKEIGEEFEFKFDYENFDMVIPLPYHYDTDPIEIQNGIDFRDEFYKKYPENKMESKVKFEKYNDRMCFATLDSFSKIEKLPIVEFDLDQMSRIRDERINKILKQ